LPRFSVAAMAVACHGSMSDFVTLVVRSTIPAGPGRKYVADVEQKPICDVEQKPICKEVVYLPN
jgi:hypothetical protein